VSVRGRASRHCDDDVTVCPSDLLSLSVVVTLTSVQYFSLSLRLSVCLSVCLHFCNPVSGAPGDQTVCGLLAKT